MNAVANNFEVPLLIIVNQYQGEGAKLKLDRKWFESEVFSVSSKVKADWDVCHVDILK